ncbi:MAG: nucleotidyltransferase domain-containing protein [Prevotella sp.]|nr:nucleotidyltransferase domain-containing protein [Prevotella sp.]
MERSTQQIVQDIAKLKAKMLPSDGRLILYGSQARGDATKASDWDLLMLLNQKQILFADFDKYAYPFVELGLSHGEYFSIKQYTVNEWEQRKGTPFYKNVTKDGIEI